MDPKLIAFPNGLRAVFAPCEAESVVFGLFVDSGSRHEPADLAGISHFIEHMLFKGTVTRSPLDISRAIEGRGGNFNACTGEESTCYFAHLPDEYLTEAIDILTDMYLHAGMPRDEFDREKQVVIEEIRMYADEPDSVAAENLQRALFPKCPLGAPIAGSAKTLAPLVPADLKRYVRSHYLPANTVAVVVGSFDPALARQLLARGLGRLRRTDPAPVYAPVDFAVPPVPATVAEKDVNQVQLALGYRTFGHRDPRRYALTLLDAVLGRGMSSRLFQEVREKRGLSYDVSSRAQLFDDAGCWSVTAGVDPAKTDRALATIDRELKRIATTRVGAAELARTKEFLVGNFRLSHEKLVSKMFYYGSTLLSEGRIVAPREQVAALNAVTADEVRAVAAALFRPENRSVSRVVPKRRK